MTTIVRVTVVLLIVLALETAGLIALGVVLIASRRTLSATGRGFAVKNQGDGFMIAFAEPVDAARVADLDLSAPQHLEFKGIRGQQTVYPVATSW
jgi:class 3 adenylate cyclase